MRLQIFPSLFSALSSQSLFSPSRPLFGRTVDAPHRRTNGTAHNRGLLDVISDRAPRSTNSKCGNQIRFDANNDRPLIGWASRSASTQSAFSLAHCRGTTIAMHYLKNNDKFLGNLSQAQNPGPMIVFFRLRVGSLSAKRESEIAP